MGVKRDGQLEGSNGVTGSEGKPWRKEGKTMVGSEKRGKGREN